MCSFPKLSPQGSVRGVQLYHVIRPPICALGVREVPGRDPSFTCPCGRVRRRRVDAPMHCTDAVGAIILTGDVHRTCTRAAGDLNVHAGSLVDAERSWCGRPPLGVRCCGATNGFTENKFKWVKHSLSPLVVRLGVAETVVCPAGIQQISQLPSSTRWWMTRAWIPPESTTSSWAA